MACNVLLDYSYFDEELKIHTNARNFQFGAVIIKNGKPIYFYTRKLTGVQMGYTVTENSVVSIVKTLKNFLNILLGQILTIYNDHKILHSQY